MSETEDLAAFQKLIAENRYNFVKLAYLIFPFGEKGSPLEFKKPYRWQIEQWGKLSMHLMNPLTRYEAYRLIISSGNGSAKTAFGAMTLLMLMYTQRLRCRMTANTDPQMKQVIWPEYDKWYRLARFHDFFFEKLGTSIKAKQESLAETWRIDTVTWSEESPTSISGLHNEGAAMAYVFEEAPGIPAIIWDYAAGAFTEKNTIKLWFAFGNSDDPESKFEQNMVSPLWHALRIDTRTMDHVDKNQIRDWLMECGGNEDHDDFRVRVRGLPRKSAKDSITSIETVQAAIGRMKDFDEQSLSLLPGVLACDPAWTGGDETAIVYKRGPLVRLIEKYRLDKAAGDTHMVTYQKLSYWERELNTDAVFVDQGEGTAVFTLAQNDGKTHWQLVSFSSSPTDTPEFINSQYANRRAQMYYEFDAFLRAGGIIDARDPQWLDSITKQLIWTKGGRHKLNNKKLAEPKLDIKARVGQSPDVADAFVLSVAWPVTEKLHGVHGAELGSGALKMPDHPNPYDDIDVGDLYD